MPPPQQLIAAMSNDKSSDLATGGGDGRRNVVHSLIKGLKVLEAFRADKPEMTLSEIAAAAGLDPGTTFRMLNSLVAHGYVARVPDSRRFRLTMKVVDLGFRAIARMDLRDVARPALRSLVGELSEAASLGALEGADVVYLERVQAGIARLGVDIRIGTTLPAATSVIGHAILAFVTDEERARVLTAAPRPGGMTAITLSRNALDDSLAAARRDGYVMRESDFAYGLRVVAVPVLDTDGHAVAAVSVAAPAVRATPEDFLARSLTPIRAAAREIGMGLQASGSVASVA
jgi:IclR family transcriptional regulator, pca regulon regulatory protein